MVKSKIETAMILRRDLILFPPFFLLDTAGKLKVEEYRNLVNGTKIMYSPKGKEEVGFVR